MNRFNLIKKRLKSRSFQNAASRIQSIIKRYGFSTQYFKNSLNDFIQLSLNYGIVPSLPLTAKVLDRHASYFKKLQDRGVEFAVHGYKHIDYTQLNDNQTLEQLNKAIDIFKKHQIEFTGFRFPFLRRSNQKLKLLNKTKIEWDSSEVVSWSFDKPHGIIEKRWLNYQKILKTYQPFSASQTVIIPRQTNDFIEIPVSIPDDDILVERLNLNIKKIETIWKKMLYCTYEAGEILILQAHPERFYWYKNALTQLLQIVSHNTKIWKAPLRDIMNWWKEKKTFSIDINKISGNQYQISVNCTCRANILLKNIYLEGCRKNFWRSWNSVDKHRFVINSKTKPVIGINNKSPVEMKQYLQEEGFPVETSSHAQEYSLYLTHSGQFHEKHKIEILKKIKQCQFPLIRFWRWPENYLCCFALTGDIDAVDIMDYWGRFYE
jgi:hypothetical protein